MPMSISLSDLRQLVGKVIRANSKRDGTIITGTLIGEATNSRLPKGPVTTTHYWILKRKDGRQELFDPDIYEIKEEMYFIDTL